MSKSPTAELATAPAREVRVFVVVIEVRLVGASTSDAWPLKSGRSQNFVEAVRSYVWRRHRPGGHHGRHVFGRPLRASFVGSDL
jgi:hypothetical protein